MNSLENLLFGDSTTIPAKVSEYVNGAYFMLRHNTTDIAKIKGEFSKIYHLIYQQFKGVKAPHDSVRSTTRVPVPKFIDSCVKQHQPLMVSTMELSGKNDNTIISHHYLYGTSWYLKNENDDDQFTEDIEKLLRNYMTTVNREGNNFLIQPVGNKDNQAIDRNNDQTISRYIRTVSLRDEIIDEPDEETEDNLIIYFNKLRHPRSQYALFYSFIK